MFIRTGNLYFGLRLRDGAPQVVFRIVFVMRTIVGNAAHHLLGHVSRERARLAWSASDECDAIYVSAGATLPLDSWADALRPNGRLLFPLTPGDRPSGAPGAGAMLLPTRVSADDFRALHLSGHVHSVRRCARRSYLHGSRRGIRARRLQKCSLRASQFRTRPNLVLRRQRPVAFHIRNRLTRASSRLTALCRLLRCVLSPHRPRDAAFYSNADCLSGR